ncbi:hypothetical protein KI387_021311, partial [Taxus chinensis]
MASPPPSAPPEYTYHENGGDLELYRVSSLSMQGETHKSISVLRQQKEHRTRLAGLALRCSEVVFSLVSLVIMVSNKHGQPGLKFDDYEEYRYSLAISVIAFVYLAAQLGRGIYDELLGHTLSLKAVLCYIDFVCDQ